tara:strand:+ start:603 stop:815 length:213 start_codon:yes stop_codon:yes gene_type:complete
MDVVDFAKYVYKRINDREKDISETLLYGSITDWDQYKMLVGEVRGLSFAKQEMRTLLEKNTDDIEDIISS